MKTKQILEGSAIVVAVFFVFLVQNSPLITYNTYLLAILIIFSAIYISLKRRSKSNSTPLAGSPVELFGLISIIIFMVSMTNGLSSPLFFFLYFILFILAFLCESVTIWIFLAAIILYFLPITFQTPSVDNLIKLGSLLLIAPIAYFVGREFERRNALNRKIEAKTDEIIQEARLLKDDGTPKAQDESEAIDEIIEEATSLKKDAETD